MPRHTFQLGVEILFQNALRCTQFFILRRLVNYYSGETLNAQANYRERSLNTRNTSLCIHNNRDCFFACSSVLLLCLQSYLNFHRDREMKVAAKKEAMEKAAEELQKKIEQKVWINFQILLLDYFIIYQFNSTFSVLS